MQRCSQFAAGFGINDGGLVAKKNSCRRRDSVALRDIAQGQPPPTTRTGACPYSARAGAAPGSLPIALIRRITAARMLTYWITNNASGAMVGTKAVKVSQAWRPYLKATKRFAAPNAK